MRNHQQGASGASVIPPQTEGAERPCAIIGRERAKRCAIFRSEGAERPKQSERSERKYTHIIRRRERSDRAQSSAGSERSERDNPTN